MIPKSFQSSTGGCFVPHTLPKFNTPPSPLLGRRCIVALARTAPTYTGSVVVPSVLTSVPFTSMTVCALLPMSNLILACYFSIYRTNALNISRISSHRLLGSMFEFSLRRYHVAARSSRLQTFIAMVFSSSKSNNCAALVIRKRTPSDLSCSFC